MQDESSDLGYKLFVRRPRAMRLTEAGSALFNDVKPLIMSLDEVAARHMRAVPRSTLNISVQPFFASEVFVPRLAQFKADNPEIDIRVDTSDESAEKHPGTADVSIRVFRTPPKGLAHHKLFPLRLVPAGSPEFRDTLSISGNAIEGEFPLILHDSRPSAWRQWSRVAGIELPKQSTTIRLDSMIAVARAAERGLGAALVPASLCDGWFESGSLVRLFDAELTTADAYYLVCDDADKDNAGIQQFRKWVLQEFGGVT